MAYNPYLKQKSNSVNVPVNGAVSHANPYVRAGVTQAAGVGTTTVTTMLNVSQPIVTNKPKPKTTNTYQEQAVMSMTQGELLLKLYDEVIKQLNIAITSIDDQDDAVDVDDEDTAQLDILKKASRDMAIEHLEGLAKKMFEDEGQEYTEEDIKEVITEKAILDMVKQYDVRLNNNGGKAKNSRNYALIEKRHVSIKKITKILDHLRMTLNFDYEISNNLNELYLFFKKSVNEANNKNESKPLKDILPLIQDLRIAYAEADENVKTGKGQIASN